MSTKISKIKRTKEQREADMNVLSRLYVKGTSQMEIARQLGISQGQVSNDLKALLKQWQETRLDDIDRYKHEQLLRINVIEEEMWTSWEKSKTVKKVTTSKSKSGEMTDFIDPLTGKREKTGTEKYWRAGTTEEEATGTGDMQYMNGIIWCQQERAKILGAYAPKKVAATDPTGEFEAVSAKEELMGMMSTILKRAKPETPEEKDYVEGQVVTQLEQDNTREVVQPPELAARLNRERIKRLPAAPQNEPVLYDDTGAIITKAEAVEEDDTEFLANLRAKIGE